jgi:FixJ family two-component response regulator
LHTGGALVVTHKAETLHVSIVDDDDAVRKGLSRLMRSAGIESRAYESPERFLSEVHNEEHACILMDITMPRMSGLELSAQLKERGITLPVIAISARDDDDTRHLARELGVRFFMRKPVDDQALLDAISWVTHEDTP